MKMWIVLLLPTTLVLSYSASVMDRRGPTYKYKNIDIDKTSDEDTLINILIRSIYQEQYKPQPSRESQDKISSNIENNMNVRDEVKQPGIAGNRDVNRMLDHLNTDNKHVGDTLSNDSDINIRLLALIRKLSPYRRGWGNPNGGIPG